MQGAMCIETKTPAITAGVFLIGGERGRNGGEEGRHNRLI